MKHLVLALALLGGATTALAQAAPPDLKGTWKGSGQSIVYGTNRHHAGSQTLTSPPRVRDVEFTYVVEGQQGRMLWGHNFSRASGQKETFAWSLTADGRSIVGADTDGYYHISVQSADLMEVCYAHTGQAPSPSIVASCLMVSRQGR